jgi:hypothetical protein
MYLLIHVTMIASNFIYHVLAVNQSVKFRIFLVKCITEVTQEKCQISFSRKSSKRSGNPCWSLSISNSNVLMTGTVGLLWQRAASMGECWPKFLDTFVRDVHRKSILLRIKYSQLGYKPLYNSLTYLRQKEPRTVSWNFIRNKLISFYVIRYTTLSEDHPNFFRFSEISAPCTDILYRPKNCHLSIGFSGNLSTTKRV